MSCFFIVILIICCVASQTSMHFNVKTGASVTIPCDYDGKYVQHKKYWCSGRDFNFCTIQAYTNETKGSVTVTDNPAESLFTVTMDNLQTGDTGWYWCAVEIGGRTEPDVKEYLYITVKADPDPDLSVMEKRVKGDEGGNITVQCLHSAEYQSKHKQWCRYKDWSCNTIRVTETAENSTWQLSDYSTGSFSVMMRRLKKSDAGWYWCRAGDLQVPVHISVSDPPPVTRVTTTVPAPTQNATTAKSVSVHNSALTVPAVSIMGETTGSKPPIHLCLVALLLLLMILVIIIIIITIISICILRMKCKEAENQFRTRGRSNDITVHSPTFKAEDSVIYRTVSKSSASKVHEEDATYSSVSPNDVDDKTIYSSVVCH